LIYMYNLVLMFITPSYMTMTTMTYFCPKIFIVKPDASPHSGCGWGRDWSKVWNYLNCTYTSSSDSTAIGFKQDEVCFQILFISQKLSETCKTAILSYKNCHNFKKERLYKKPIVTFDLCII